MAQKHRGKHIFDKLLTRPYAGGIAMGVLDMAYHIFREDFDEFDAAHWTVVEDAGKTGTDALVDRAGGWIKTFCDGDDNDESYYVSDGENWKFAAAKGLYLETKVLLTEANTDDANWIVGLSDQAGANMLLDNGAGPAASYDGAVFFKVDGTLQVQFESSNAGTQVTTATGLATFVSGTAFVLGFYFDPGDGTTGSITPIVAGVPGTAHEITLTGLEEMHLFWGTKAGGNNEEALELDYLFVAQTR